MEANSAHPLDGTLVRASEKTLGHRHFLPIERIKAGSLKSLLVCSCLGRSSPSVAPTDLKPENMSYPYSSLYLEGQWSRLKLAKLFDCGPRALRDRPAHGMCGATSAVHFRSLREISPALCLKVLTTIYLQAPLPGSGVLRRVRQAWCLPGNPCRSLGAVAWSRRLLGLKKLSDRRINL